MFIKNVVVAFFVLTSMSSWACYFDYTTKLEGCHYTGHDFVILNCPEPSNPSVGHVKVGCWDNDIFPTYEQNHSWACSGSFDYDHVSFKRCPGDRTPHVSNSNPPDKSCKLDGSIINPNTRTFTDSIELVGVPFKLVYSNEKVIGRTESMEIRVPLTHPTATIPSDITNKKLRVTVAGKTFTSNHTPVTNLNTIFTWDGNDNLGNPAPQPTIAEVSIGEEYTLCTAPLPIPSVGSHILVSSVSSPSPGCRYQDNTLTTAVVGSIFHANKMIGGWDFEVHHHYDHLRNVLYLGDGTNFNATALLKSGGEKWIVSQDRKEVFVFDSNNRHIKTRDALTGIPSLNFNYNISNQLISIEDKYGNETTIQYSFGRPVSVTSPYGLVTSIVSDSNGYLDSVTSPANEVYDLAHSSDGLLTSLENPNGVIKTISYNSDGSLLSDISSSGHEVTLTKTYSPGGYTVTSQSALGRNSTFSVTVNGNSYTSVNSDPSGFSATQTSDFVTKNESMIVPSSHSKSSSSDPDSRFKGNFRIPVSGSISDLGVNMSWSYSETPGLSDPNDPYSFTVLSSSSTFGGKTWTSAYTASTKTKVETSPVGRINTTILNSLGDIALKQNASFTPVSYTYDPNGRIEKIAQGTNRETLYTYNANGWLDSIENELGETTQFSYDLAGRVLTQTLPDTRVITYSYDSNGNVTSITPPGKPVHEMSYNGFDYMSSYIPPTIAAPGALATTYVYNDDKQLTEINRPDGLGVDFIYGSSTGNLDQITLPSGARYFYYTSGKMTSASSEDGISKNNIYQGTEYYMEGTTKGSFWNNIYYTYNSQGLLSKERILVGSFDIGIDFTYDNDGLITVAGTQSYTRSASTGLISLTALGNVTQDFTYSSSYGELSTLQAKYSGTEVYEETLMRDDLGRVTTKTVQYQGGTTDTYVYGFDTTGRLSTVTLNSSLLRTYGYDSNSNRTSLTGVSGITYDDQDRLLTYGTKSFTYNRNGELSSITDSATSSTTNYTYDVLGNLKSVALPAKTINYLVDSSDRRTVRLDGTTVTNYYLWNKKNQLIGITNGSGVLSANFVYGSKGHVPDYMVTSTSEYQIITNHLGSPVQVINKSTGVIAQEIKYDEFGNITSDTNPGFTPFGFAGCLFDQETGLCRFGARDYDSSIGRWLSKDPILFEGGDTNLYGYTFQDPINYIDVDGNIAIPLIIPLIPALTNTALWGGLIVSGATLIDTLIDAYSKGGKQNVKDTGLQDLTDAELEQRLKTATGKEKLRYIKELKGRKLRNKKKREGC